MAQRAASGTVAVEDKQGKWRIRLPRAVAKDSARYIATRLDATPENFKKVQITAWTIEEDLKTGQFDTTLEKYKPKSMPTLVKKEAHTSIDLSELWDRYCEFKKSQVAITTFKREYRLKYANQIKSLPTRDLQKAIVIRDYLVTNVSALATKRLLTLLSACCKWAVSSGLIKDNPFAGMAKDIKLPKKDIDSIDPFSIAERDAIIRAFQDHPTYRHYYPFVRFLFLTGCRTGEAIALQWKHINRDCTQITFAESYSGDLKVRKTTKTGNTRQFPCNQVLRELLLSIRPVNYQPNDLVFTSTTGIPINNGRFTSRIWKGGTYGGKVYRGIVTQLATDGKVDRYRCLYNTRHTFITMALEAGVTIPQVARLVGNSAEIILKHYAGNLMKMEVPVF